MRQTIKLSDVSFVAQMDPVTRWQNRCKINGSAGPSAATVSAMRTFYAALVSAGIHTKFKTLNCIVPDDLICAKTPLIVGNGLDPWTNGGSAFVSGDLTVEGLKSDASKWLNTGVNPTTAFTNNYSTGLTVLVTVAGADAAYSIDVGARNVNATQDLMLFTDWNNFSYFNYGNAGSGDALGLNRANNLKDLGYHSGNVTASNSQKYYWAAQAAGHTTLITGTTGIVGIRPDLPLYVFGVNENGSPTYLTTRRYSFVAVHDGLTEAESTALYTAVQALRSSLGGGMALTVADLWKNRCIANGSAGPSTAVVSAMHTFYAALVTAGIHTKMKAVNCFVPTDLICARTPLIVGDGIDPWTNGGNAFLSGDLTVNGLKSDGLKWLNSGVNPNTAFADNNSNGITLVSTVSVTENARDAGVASATGNSDWALYTDWSNVVIWDFGNVVGGDRITATSRKTGYTSGNVVAIKDQKIYFGSTAEGHATIATRTTTDVVGPRPNRQAYVFVANDGNADPGYKGSKRLSFAAFHLGLTLSESASLYAAVQALRTSLGGGTV